MSRALREIIEVIATSDGYIPETAIEKYQEKLLSEILEIAVDYLDD
jgi:hypothetical protein